MNDPKTRWQNDWSWLGTYSRWVVLGSDTEVGKTHFACDLIHELKGRYANVSAFKPAASGGGSDDDATRLAAAANYLQTLDAICPYRFDQPIAPVLAAELQGESIDCDLIEAALSNALTAAACVVETAGGLLSPLNWQRSNLQWAAELARRWSFQLVLIVPNRLGAVNATLQAWQTIAAQRVNVAAIVLNEYERWGGDAKNWEQNVSMIQRVMPCFAVTQQSPPPLYRYRSSDR